MGFAILPHTEIVNYTKGLMLLHVPRTLALCFMMTTVKTRSVLKLSWSSPALLQFYLSCPFKEGTKACSRSYTSRQPLHTSVSQRHETALFIIICMRQQFLERATKAKWLILIMWWDPGDLKVLSNMWKPNDRKGKKHCTIRLEFWQKNNNKNHTDQFDLRAQSHQH